MTIEEMRQHEWVVSWSGGKDSTATVILCHEYGIPIKKIVYVRMMYDDTLPATLPIMTDFVDECAEKFRAWSYDVRIIPSLGTAKEYSKKIYKRSIHQDRNGKPYGISNFSRGKCVLVEGVKIKTIHSIGTPEWEMIGYASDETKRLHRLGGTKQSIMVELGITEAEAFNICRKHGMLSPLYDLGIKRDGCWFCPNSTGKQIEFLKTNYPELKREIDKMIVMSEFDICSLYTKNNWVKDFFDTRGFVPKPLPPKEEVIVEKQLEGQKSIYNYL